MKGRETQKQTCQGQDIVSYQIVLLHHHQLKCAGGTNCAWVWGLTITYKTPEGTVLSLSRRNLFRSTGCYRDFFKVYFSRHLSKAHAIFRNILHLQDRLTPHILQVVLKEHLELCHFLGIFKINILVLLSIFSFFACKVIKYNLSLQSCNPLSTLTSLLSL